MEPDRKSLPFAASGLAAACYLAALAACFNPFNPAFDNVECGAGDACPPGYACDTSAQLCRPEGEPGSDAGNADDAPPGDPDAGDSPDAAGPISFLYNPSNFMPDSLTPSGAVRIDCDAGFDSTTGTFSDWCSTEPTVTMLPEHVILASEYFEIATGGSVTITGDRPVIFAVFGNATIDGRLDASASGDTPGPGGSMSEHCESGTGQAGDSNSGEGGGGGGGGFGSSGASGGDGDGGFGGQGGDPGQVVSNEDLIPLHGGCSGGSGGPGTAPGGLGGGGGGGLQISAAQTVIVASVISAGGGGGRGATTGDGGGGGGSGGGILLEAGTTHFTALARVTANGGGGGKGGNSVGSAMQASGSDGTPDSLMAASGGSGGGNGGNGGSGATQTSAVTPGLNGGRVTPGPDGGGGGGGGGLGRIRVNAVDTCIIDQGSIVSPTPSTDAPGGCNSSI